METLNEKDFADAVTTASAASDRRISGYALPMRSKWRLSRVERVTFSGVDFAGVMMGGVMLHPVFDGCVFDDVDFGPISGRRVTFTRCAFVNVRMGGQFQADFKHSHFLDC